MSNYPKSSARVITALATLVLLLPAATAQILPGAEEQRARVWFEVPHLVRGVPGGEATFRITVHAQLDCDGSEAPAPVQVYMPTGRSHTEGSPTGSVEVWRIEPASFFIPWRHEGDSYRIDQMIDMRVVSEAGPSKELDAALVWSTTAGPRQDGPCAGGHAIDPSPAQSALLMPAAAGAEAVAGDVPGEDSQAAPAPGPALLAVAVAAMLGRRFDGQQRRRGPTSHRGAP